MGDETMEKMSFRREKNHSLRKNSSKEKKTHMPDFIQSRSVYSSQGLK